MSFSHLHLPIVGFVAPSGTGKTTLLCQLLPMLKSAGIRTAVIKHSHHDFEIDIPGKDSYELRHAGAEQMLIASRNRTALIIEKRSVADEANLDECLHLLDQRQLDIIIVEGFKYECFPKIELYRAGIDNCPLYPTDADIIALLSDCPVDVERNIDVLDLNATEEIFNYIVEKFKLKIIENYNHG